MTKYEEFLQAAKDIDALALEGFGGHTIKQLVEERDKTDLDDFFSRCLDVWIESDNQVRKETVKEFITIFFKIYVDSIQKNGQLTIDTLTAFWIGFEENPETECLSSYTEFKRSQIETTKLTMELNARRPVGIAEEKKLADSYIHTYSKGVELIRKILTICILLRQIVMGEDIEPLKINNLFLGGRNGKVQLFKKIFDKPFYKILDVLHKDIRNADAHLDIRYDSTNMLFKLKVKQGQNVKIRDIPVNQMINDIYPKVGNLIEAFVLSQALLCLRGTNLIIFEKKVKQIFD